MRKNYYLTKIIAFIITGCSDKKRHETNIEWNSVSSFAAETKYKSFKLASQTLYRYLEKGLSLIRKFKVGSSICLRTSYKVVLKIFQND